MFFCFTVYRHIIPTGFTVITERSVIPISPTLHYSNYPFPHSSNIHHLVGRMGNLVEFGVDSKAVKTDLASLKISFTIQPQPAIPPPLQPSNTPMIHELF